MKKLLLTLAFGVASLGAFAQAAPAPPASLIQVNIESQDEVVDVQFNNPLQDELSMVLLGPDGHVVFRKIWKNTDQYHGQFVLDQFPAGEYLLEIRRADTTLSRERVNIGQPQLPTETLANKP